MLVLEGLHLRFDGFALCVVEFRDLALLFETAGLPSYHFIVRCRHALGAVRINLRGERVGIIYRIGRALAIFRRNGDNIRRNLFLRYGLQILRRAKLYNRKAVIAGLNFITITDRGVSTKIIHANRLKHCNFARLLQASPLVLFIRCCYDLPCWIYTLLNILKIWLFRKLPIICSVALLLLFHLDNVHDLIISAGRRVLVYLHAYDGVVF